MMTTTAKTVRKIVRSKALDLFGAALILGITLYRGFHLTLFSGGKIQFAENFGEVMSQVGAGAAFPLGILSIIGAVFSLLSTRLVGKQQNSGNVIGVFTTVNSGTIDYLFGNHSAVLTYPITFIISLFAVKRWSDGERIKKIDLRYYIIIAIGILVGFGLVYLGAHWFGGKTDTLFLNTVAITFGLSVGANICNALKYEETWLSWVVYNIVNLVKNILINNLANVVKYIFYLFNAVVTLTDWKLNGDAEVISESVNR